jgi:heme-degrading monooxygenase HmoA
MRRYAARLQIIKQLEGVPGLVGWSLGADLANLEFHTLSAWEDTESLRAFTTSAAHGEALPKFEGDMRADSVLVQFSVFGKELPLRWADAIARQEAQLAEGEGLLGADGEQDVLPDVREDAEHDERTRERIEAALVLGDDLRLDSRPELVERWATPSGSSRGVAQAQWMGSRISSSSERGGSPIRLSESSSAISAGVLRRRAVSKATPATIVPATKENAPSRWKKSGSHPSGWGVGEALDAWTRA